MRKLRKCNAADLYTGGSKCPPNFEEIIAAILVKPGTKLPADLTPEKLEELVHADRKDRAYVILRFVEYAKNGGETQTGADGYGPEEETGISARRDTFTLQKFSPELDASLTKCSNQPWDVYFVDVNGLLHGINDGTDILAGYPMSGVYSDSTPFKTSSARPAQTVSFMHKDARLSKTRFDYVELGFDIDNTGLELTLTPVKLVKADGGNDKYKLIEAVGGYDVTSIYGALIATGGANVISGATTAATYDEDTETLTIAATAGTTPRLKPAATLYEHDIKGIEQVAA